MKEEIGSFMSGVECPDCHGKRLKPVSAGGDRRRQEHQRLLRAVHAGTSLKFIADNEPELTEKQKQIGGQIMKEIKNRLRLLAERGTRLPHAGPGGRHSVRRREPAHPPGDPDRQCALTGVLYVLDEPSIGLHQRDNDKLHRYVENICATSATPSSWSSTMRIPCAAADYIVDVGPGAGVHGGEIVAAGSVKDICKAKRSITGDYLSGRKRIEVPQTRRTGNGKFAHGERGHGRTICGISM